MGNGILCVYPEKKYKNIQKQYSMIDLLIGLRPNNKLYELNALLQCLCHIESLVNFFKYKCDEIKTYNGYKKYKGNGLCLTDCFKSIVDGLWPDFDTDNKNKSKIKTYRASQSSKEFLDMIYKIYPDYNENQEYLLKFMQKRLHEELNKVEKQNPNFSNTIDLSDINMSLENYKINFKKNDQSIISAIFYGTYYSYSKFFCGHQEYHFHSYTLGFYSFQQVLEYKILTYQNRQNPLYINRNINMNEINIYDCLFYDNQIKFGYKLCQKCSIQQQCNNQNFIYSPPKILCFVFNKNENIIINNFNFIIENDININQFVENKDMIYYELFGIIVYFYPKRYVALSKNPVNLQWYSYDNDIVEKKYTIQEILKNKYIPYMLFYRHKKNFLK